MKIPILLLILISLVYQSYGQEDRPFSTLAFDKVMMYQFNGGQSIDSMYIVDTQGELSTSITNKVELTPQEVKDLNAKIENKKSYGEATMDCFNAHLGFVYYLKNKIVAHVTISSACKRLHSSIDIPAQKQGKVSVGTDIYYTATGLSESFINFINAMIVKYHFTHP